MSSWELLKGACLGPGLSWDSVGSPPLRLGIYPQATLCPRSPASLIPPPPLHTGRAAKCPLLPEAEACELGCGAPFPKLMTTPCIFPCPPVKVSALRLIPWASSRGAGVLPSLRKLAKVKEELVPFRKGQGVIRARRLRRGPSEGAARLTWTRAPLTRGRPCRPLGWGNQG